MSDTDLTRIFLQKENAGHIFRIWLPDMADRTALRYKKLANHTVQEIVKKFSELSLLL